MKKLFKNISIYSFGGILNKSIQFLLLPLYTRVLVPADYGKLELVYLIGAVLAIINGFLVQNAYTRFYFDKSERQNYQGRLYSSALFFMILCSGITTLLCFTFSDSIANQIFDFANGGIYVRLISISSLLMAISSVPEKTLIVQERSKTYIAISIINTLSTIGFIIYFVLILKLNILGVLWGQIIGRSIRFILMFSVTYKIINITFSLRLIQNLLAYSIFLVPSQLASFITYFSNRLFLQEFNTLEDVGLFSLAYKIASVIPILVTGPVKLAFNPYIYSKIENPLECKINLKKFTRLFLLILISFAITLSLFSKELILLMSDQAYHNSYQLVFPLSMSYVFIGMAGIVVTAINIIKKTWIITITWIITSIINLLSNYLLINAYGTYGACFATIITFLVILCLYFLFVERYYKIGFEYIKYLQILILAIFIYFFSEFIDVSIVTLIIIKIILIIGFILFLYKYFLKENEKANLLIIISDIRNKFSKK